MNRTMKITISVGASLAAGAVLFAGASWADRSFGFSHGMRMGMLGGLHTELLRGVDTDADGRLTQQEVDAAVRARVTRFDADGNGTLSLEEFQALWADLTRPVAVRAFQFLDPDGDAAVTQQELESRFSRIVQRLDRNSDGALSPEDRLRHGHYRGWGPDGGGFDRN